MPSPDLDLAKLKAAVAKATKGRWFGQYEYDGARTICQMRSTDTTFCINVESDSTDNPCLQWRENAEAITMLWEMAPALIDEIDQLREAAAKWKREECAHCDERAGGYQGTIYCEECLRQYKEDYTQQEVERLRGEVDKAKTLGAVEELERVTGIFSPAEWESIDSRALLIQLAAQLRKELA